MRKRIAISIGDINGIGPEVVIKSLQSINLDGITPIILSSTEVLDFWSDNLSTAFDYHYAKSITDITNQKINLLESYSDRKLNITPGSFTKQSGKCAMLAVEKGIELCKENQADALVTAPISKEAVNLAGYHIPGHTEFLAEKTNTTDFMMMLVHEQLRVGLVTGHLPIANVSESLSVSLIQKYIHIMQHSINRDFGIAQPDIAVLGLNPHAGDGGVIGSEDQEIIVPAIEQSKADGVTVSGPYPADGFFGNKKYEQFDGVLAMYHDQGLIPFKTIAFGGGVNFTAGLPIIRTSPDHGTAFDIAGENKADPSSFIEAFTLANTLITNRAKKLINDE
ncbi:4-hydroxythreonine-4-phosphate dehydrogenase PdxA [Fodinibius sp. Rm-B-1B1-1]|uniref:4-hydroxythreonine-4-phosphate dehydrogenase PdxA n=1 Tax=Fodinibius alkaliphilus TaxID=3140241 RepID=UPI00315A43DE